MEKKDKLNDFERECSMLYLIIEIKRLNCFYKSITLCHMLVYNTFKVMMSLGIRALHSLLHDYLCM